MAWVFTNCECTYSFWYIIVVRKYDTEKRSRIIPALTVAVHSFFSRIKPLMEIWGAFQLVNYGNCTRYEVSTRFLLLHTTVHWESMRVERKDELQSVILYFKTHATRDIGNGWKTSRHHVVPTTDILLHNIIKIRDWFCGVWRVRRRGGPRAPFNP